MDELKPELDRLADRAGDPARSSGGAEALERLHVARDRRNRRRRVTAGALAIVVAVAGTLTVVTAFRGNGDDGAAASATSTPSPSVVAWVPPAVPYLWPENWARDADTVLEQVQTKVDAGQKDLQWRTDPREVAKRFAENVLGWSSVIAGERSLGPGVPGVVFELIPCPDLPGVHSCPIITGPQQYVWVQQPGHTGEGGIWDVAGVWADTLDVGIGHQLSADVEALVGGATLHMDLAVPKDETVSIGFAGQNGCSGFAGASQGPTLGEGAATLDLPNDPSDCGTGVAYAYAYTVPALNQPIGDPFLEPGDVVAVTAMPFYLYFPSAGSPAVAPSGTAGRADQVNVVCDATSASIDGPGQVIAQPDGVHIAFVNATDERLSVSFDRAGMGDGGDPGETELVVDTPPGPETVTCETVSHTIGSASFEVVDPNGYWVSPELAGTSCGGSSIDYASVPDGEPDPLVAARGAGVVEPGDELRLAGYPGWRDGRTVLVIRDGVAVASVDLARGTSGWYVSGSANCA